MKKNFRITVSGRVQGVGFRYSAMDEAFRLNIKGFVRNNPDHTVFIEAEGESAGLEKFLDWCRKGPPGAQVTHIEVSEGSVSGYNEFRITR